MAAPEDVLLHKVYWNKMTPSERQIGDARGIAAVQGERLDQSYIRKWARAMNIEKDIDEIMTGKDLPKIT